MRPLYILAIIFLLSGCANNVLSGSWYNSNLDMIKFSVDELENDKKIVTVKNLSRKALRYMAAMGFPNSPSYYLLVKTEDGEKIIPCNVGEFSHDYTIGKDKELSFSFENSANLIKVGLPIYNEKYEEYVIWFYATST